MRKAIPIILTMLTGFWAGDLICAHVRARIAAGDTVNQIINSWMQAFKQPLAISTQQADMLAGLAVAAVIGLAWLYQWAQRGNFRTGEEFGSARWAKPNEMAPYTDRDSRGNLQMTLTEGLSIDTPATRRNLNVTVLGSAGSGKTSGYVLPNILRGNMNWAVTDPKGELYEGCKRKLEHAGYTVTRLDLVNLTHDTTFNPLAYINPEQPDTAIMRLISNLMDNTTSAEAKNHSQDGFWDKAERSLLTSLAALVYHTDDDPTLNKVADLALKMEASEQDETMESDVDVLMHTAESIYKDVLDHPDEWDEEARATAEGLRFAVTQYRPFTQGAGETKKSVIISVGVRLAPLQVGPVRDILATDSIGIDRFVTGDKTAIFLALPDEDPTFNFIAAIFYQSLFDHVIRATRTLDGQRLPRPLHCMLDEFANVGRIPNFERLIATIRSRGVSASIILQTIGQLKAMYKDGWETIIGNCDSVLFLGGNEQSTTEWVSKRLGKETIDMKESSQSKGRNGSVTYSRRRTGRELLTPDELGQLDNTSAVYMLRGVHPFLSRKIQPGQTIPQPKKSTLKHSRGWNKVA